MVEGSFLVQGGKFTPIGRFRHIVRRQFSHTSPGIPEIRMLREACPGRPPRIGRKTGRAGPSESVHLIKHGHSGLVVKLVRSSVDLPADRLQCNSMPGNGRCGRRLRCTPHLRQRATNPAPCSACFISCSGVARSGARPAASRENAARSDRDSARGTAPVPAPPPPLAWAEAVPAAARTTRHSSAPDQETGFALNARMHVPGQFAYGRLKYDVDVRSINVIGVRQGGAWKIYAQKVEKQNLTIRSVTRIFPPD